MTKWCRWLKDIFIINRNDDGMYPEDENGAW